MMSFLFGSSIGRALLVTLAGAISLMTAYGIGYQYGQSSMQVEMARAEERVLASQRVDEANRTASHLAVLTATEAINADLREKLAKLESAKPETVTKEVVKYVTVKADAACPVTVGFKWVYNTTLEGVSPDSSVTRSALGDVDAPSGITLSRLASVAGANNIECADRGKIIEAWQQWYLRNKKAIDSISATPR